MLPLSPHSEALRVSNYPRSLSILAIKLSLRDGMPLSFFVSILLALDRGSTSAADPLPSLMFTIKCLWLSWVLFLETLPK